MDNRGPASGADGTFHYVRPFRMAESAYYHIISVNNLGQWKSFNPVRILIGEAMPDGQADLAHAGICGKVPGNRQRYPTSRPYQRLCPVQGVSPFCHMTL
jgi:hypothetical protein